MRHYFGDRTAPLTFLRLGKSLTSNPSSALKGFDTNTER
jgi:hypothetical protein